MEIETAADPCFERLRNEKTLENYGVLEARRGNYDVCKICSIKSIEIGKGKVWTPPLERINWRDSWATRW